MPEHGLGPGTVALFQVMSSGEHNTAVGLVPNAIPPPLSCHTNPVGTTAMHDRVNDNVVPHAVIDPIQMFVAAL